MGSPSRDPDGAADPAADTVGTADATGERAASAPGGDAGREEGVAPAEAESSRNDRFNSRLRRFFGSSPFILTKFDTFMNWVRSSSAFQLQFGIACCSLEMMHSYTTKHDLDRFGVGVPRASPRQADMIIIPGTIVSKFAPRMRRVYDQMPEPKFVVGMGVCTISGGPFQEGYNVVKGAQEVIPMDIQVPGCPPRAEALVYAIAKLQERIANGEASPVAVKPYELEQFADLERDEIIADLADDIDEETLVMRYNWAESP